MENSAEFYYEKLKSTDNPGGTLAAFLCLTYDKEVTRREVIICNKLIKIFGRFTLFFAIIDMAGSYPSMSDNVYPLLYTICKRKFESQHAGSVLQSRESLTSFIKDINADINKQKKAKIKIPSSEGLE